MINVEANRAAKKWSQKTQIARVLWACFVPFFALSPRPLHVFRCFLLRLFGAHIGKNVYILPSVKVSMPWNISISEKAAIGDRVILYALGQISIGQRVTISQGAHLCAGTHDYRDSAMPLLKVPISIGCDAWVCADAFIGPGVSIGDRAIVGARAVVVSDVEPGAIVAGNPAKHVKWRV